tara:strand:- start:783 stop:1340 length:558 start_codon:yes stop_codon:yes gene_type:complete
MDSIKLRFTDNIIEKAKEKTPDKVKQKYVVENKFSYKYGYVRFDEDKLTSLYIYPNGYDVPNSDFPPIFKFDFIDGEINFKYFYDFVKDENDDTFVEGRYDEEMNLESEYNHFNETKSVEGGKLFCSKEKDGETINYIVRDGVKDFTDYLKYLNDNDVVANDGTHNFCYWGQKQNKNIIYLGITT